MDNDIKFDIMPDYYFEYPFYSTAEILPDGRIRNCCASDLQPAPKEGLIVKVAEDKIRILLGNEYEPYLYRGENDIFDYFQPSLQRLEVNSPAFCYAWVKKETFKEEFKKTPYYNKLCNLRVFNCSFDFDLEAIAQHYEYKTDYIDLTRNKEVAEFFAYTYWDRNSQSYKPITENHTPILYRAKMADVMKYDSSIFQIVGFQTCLRPLKQQAMALDLSNGNKTIREDLFEKIPLENTKQKAEEIFNRFEGGKLLFPDETILRLKNLVDNCNIIPEYCVQKYANSFNIPYHKVRPMLLRNFDVKIKQNHTLLNNNLHHKMSVEFDNEIKRWLEENTTTRLATRITG